MPTADLGSYTVLYRTTCAFVVAVIVFVVAVDVVTNANIAVIYIDNFFSMPFLTALIFLISSFNDLAFARRYGRTGELTSRRTDGRPYEPVICGKSAFYETTASVNPETESEKETHSLVEILQVTSQI